MAKLTTDEVKHIAKLSKLTLTDLEITKFRHQLFNVLTYMDELNEVETVDTPPTIQTTGLENVYRADKPGDCLPSSKAISTAKRVSENYIVTKGVLHK